jgi:hypothetical protein
VHSAQVALWGKVLVVVNVVAAATHLVGSSVVMFTAMEHLVFASGTVAIAFAIGDAAFASVSAFGSSTVA